MVFVLEEVSRSVADHVQAGRSVRIVGDVGSGRSSVLRRTAELLEAAGHSVFAIRGEAPESGGAGLAQLGIETLGRRLTDATDALSIELTEAPRPTLIVDDANRLDAPSLRALETVRERLGVPIVCVEGLGADESAHLRPYWPEVRVRVPPLTLHQTSTLVSGILHGPADLDLVAAVLVSTAGNARLITAVVDVAVRNRRMVQEEHGWVLTGSLWSPELISIIDAHVRRVRKARRVLRWVVAHTTETTAVLEERFGQSMVRELFERGWLFDARSAGHSGIEIGPKLVLSRYRADAVGGDTDNLQPIAAPLAAGYPGKEDGSQPADSTIALLFERSALAMCDRLYRWWSDDRNTRSGLDFLFFAAGYASEKDRVVEVMSETPIGIVSDVMDVYFISLHIRWLLSEGDAAAAKRRLNEAVFATNDLAAQVGAMFAVAGWIGGHTARPATDLAAGNPSDESGVLAVAICQLHLFSGELEAADRALHKSPEGYMVKSAASYFDPFISLLHGEFDQALAAANATRERALAWADRAAYIGASYVAALAYRLLGDGERGRGVVSSAVAVGPPGPSMREAYEALVTMLNAQERLTSVAYQPGSLPTDTYQRPLPIPWSGEPWIRVDAPMTTDETIAVGASELAATGAILAGAFLALEGTIRFGAGASAIELVRLAESMRVPLFHDVVGLIKATRNGGAAAAQWVASYQERGEATKLVARVLSSIGRTSTWPIETTRIFEDSVRVHPVFSGLVRTAAVDRLSTREREIGRLGGRMTNSEIARHLGITVRTVENHLSRALGKSGAADRRALAELLT